MGCRFAERTTDEGDNVARIGEKSEMGGMAMMKNWEGSCSDYVIYVLKQLGDIKVSDVEDIVFNFGNLDPDKTGRVALPGC
ncbi:hypothetical protein AAC387_Pa10g2102 [Persea americana]